VRRATPGDFPTRDARPGLAPWVGVALSVLLLAASCGADGGGGDTESRILDYLRSSSYDRLVFEVDRVGERGPRSRAEDLLIGGVEAIVDKPGGVSIVYDDVLEAGGPWSYDALRQLADETYDGQPGAATVHVMIVDGTYADPNALGVAWDHRHIALFADVIEAQCAGLAAALSTGLSDRACDRTWMSIWAHELGHVVGLVDLGTTMQEPHRDPGGTHHCDDESCLMWRSHDGSDLLEHVRGRIERDEVQLGFDAACLADLAAARGTPTGDGGT